MNTVTRTGCFRSARIFRVFSESEKILVRVQSPRFQWRAER
jgi:hypothetical protein